MSFRGNTFRWHPINWNKTVMIRTKIQTKKQKLLNTFSVIERLLTQLPELLSLLVRTCKLMIKVCEHLMSLHLNQQGTFCPIGNSVNPMWTLDSDTAWQFPMWYTVSSYFFRLLVSNRAHLCTDRLPWIRVHTDSWIAARSLNVIYFPLKADYYGANLNYDVETALEYWAVYEFFRWAQWTANTGTLPCEV